jgi:integrase
MKAGFYADGNGLYLAVSASGARSWIYRYRVDKKKVRDMGLGPLRLVPLALARVKALDAARARFDGVDPLDQKKERKAAKNAKEAKSQTFWQVAMEFIAKAEGGFKNPKTAPQWTSSLEAYAKPTIGDVEIDKLDTPMIVKVLEPIWATKTETASRVRGRIEKILDYAERMKFRTGANPARWKGNLDFLPKPSKVHTVKHHPSLPWDQLPEFWRLLSSRDGNDADALRLAILTATRTQEIIGAPWAEVDFESRIWAIPKERMKSTRDFRVALSEEAIGILRARHDRLAKTSQFVFPGLKKEKSMSNGAMLALLRRMERKDITTHGFRSSFRDWCGDTEEGSKFPRELAELSLAHAVGDETERAYRRGDGLKLRFSLMETYAGFVTGAKKRERRSHAGRKGG